MKSETEIADARDLIVDVLEGTLDLGDVPEEVGAFMAYSADALDWVLGGDSGLAGNLTSLRLSLMTKLSHGRE